MPVTATSSRLFSSATVPPALVQSDRPRRQLAGPGRRCDRERRPRHRRRLVARRRSAPWCFAKVRLAAGLVILAIATAAGRPVDCRSR